MKQQQQQQQQISKNTTEFILCCCSQLGMEPALKGGSHTEGDSVGGNSVFVGEQLTLEASFRVGVGARVLLSALGWRLMWTWAGPLCAATVSVSSCVHQPCCVGRTPSLWCGPSPADSNSLPTSSSA